jgi:hypothetical protein
VSVRRAFEGDNLSPFSAATKKYRVISLHECFGLRKRSPESCKAQNIDRTGVEGAVVALAKEKVSDVRLHLFVADEQHPSPDAASSDDTLPNWHAA